MTYPPCPRGTPDACQFEHSGGFSTAMHSPIVYNRDGKPVGGGANSQSSGLSCWTCGRHWEETRTELQRAQGVAPSWVAWERERKQP